MRRLLHPVLTTPESFHRIQFVPYALFVVLRKPNIHNLPVSGSVLLDSARLSKHSQTTLADPDQPTSFVQLDLAIDNHSFRIPVMAFSSLSGVIEPFSKYLAAPSWMSFFPFFSDGLLIINTGISVVDGVCFNVRSTSTPSISGRSMARRIYVRVTCRYSEGTSSAAVFLCGSEAWSVSNHVP